MARVVILGAGAMGSAMAAVVGDAGHSVALVGTHLDDAIVQAVAHAQPHPKLGVKLPPTVTAHSWDRLGELMTGDVDLLVLGVSSAGVDWAITRIAAALTVPVPIVVLTKGLAVIEGSIDLLPNVITRGVGALTGLALPVMAVGGPCIAGELAAKRNTTVVVAGHDEGLLRRTIDLFDVPYYHARVSRDLAGVEVCAAFKNLYAIGVGWAAGMLEREGQSANGALMHNLAAALFAQALTELSILVDQLGGDRSTVAGLAGAGDLYVTCQGGRNGRLGRLLGQGLTYSKAKSEHIMTDTVEGAELAFTIEPILDAMVAEGGLPGNRMHLTSAIVGAICGDEPLDMPWMHFHRGS